VKKNPYVDSNLDVVETVLTLILLFLSCCGMVFAAYTENGGFLPWHLESLSWLAYLSMVLGSLLCSALLANEAFEQSCAWYLNRVSFLGDASADAKRSRAELAYSKSAVAHVEMLQPSSNAISMDTAPSSTVGRSLAIRRSVSDAFQWFEKRLSKIGSYVATQDQGEEEVSSKDTNLFYLVNLLRFHQSMKGLDASDKSSCATAAL
jgi:hypothetical protein